MSSSPGKGGSCTSETKLDRRTMRRSMLFILERKLQEQGPKPPESVLGSTSDFFFKARREQDRKTAPRLKLFVLVRRLQK
jgi:hypothetical protein